MKHLSLALLLTFLCISSSAQYFPKLTYQRFFDNFGVDDPQCLIKATDGHLIIGGNTVTNENKDDGCTSIWIIKVDTLGDMIWEQEIALSGCEAIRDIAETADGGGIFVGVTSSLIQHEENGDETYWGDYFVGKFDGNGIIEWLESYGGSELDQAFAISEGREASYVILGGAHSSDGDVAQNNGMSDIWALKIDTKGNPQFQKVMGDIGTEWASSVTTCRNGDYLVAGYTNSASWAQARMSSRGGGLIMRLDSTGKEKWRKVFSCPQGGYFSDVRESVTQRIVIAGNYLSEDTGYDFWWLILDKDGKQVAEYKPDFSQNEYLTSIALCQDGGFIFGGYSTPRGKIGALNKGLDDFWMIRTDTKGRTVWQNTYGGPNNERCSDLIEYRKGIYFAIGQKLNDFSEDKKGDEDFWMVKIEELPTDSIEADIFIRAKNYRVDRLVPTRFRAKYKYGDRFLWEFGDGTTSTEEQPLKAFQLSGVYEVKLTVFVNETCQQTVKLPRKVEVW
ncbi:MAG: PKD domain-containing protein [Bacteroidota bacterium]